MASTKRSRARKRRWAKKRVTFPLTVGQRIIAHEKWHGVVIGLDWDDLPGGGPAGHRARTYEVLLDEHPRGPAQPPIKFLRGQLVPEVPAPVHDRVALEEWLSAKS